MQRIYSLAATTLYAYTAMFEHQRSNEDLGPANLLLSASRQKGEQRVSVRDHRVVDTDC